MIRPGGEQERGPLTGRFMGVGELGQLWGAEFKHRCYTGFERGFQLHFYDLRSHSDQNKRLASLKKKAGEILVNNDVFCYFVLPSERTDAMLPVDVT